VEVRIGVIYTPKEIEVELGDDADREQLLRDIEAALADDGKVLWLTDKKGRSVGVPAGKVAYVEVAAGHGEGRRVGFGAQ
jgi:hypothetical protein